MYEISSFISPLKQKLTNAHLTTKPISSVIQFASHCAKWWNGPSFPHGATVKAKQTESPASITVTHCLPAAAVVWSCITQLMSPQWVSPSLPRQASACQHSSIASAAATSRLGVCVCGRGARDREGETVDGLFRSFGSCSPRLSCGKILHECICKRGPVLYALTCTHTCTQTHILLRYFICFIQKYIQTNCMT